MSRASNGINLNVQNSNTATILSPSCPPQSPLGILPIIPPVQPDYNYPERDIEEILKKKAYLRMEFEVEMVRRHSQRRKELRAKQESN